jgi:hypothetical protein
MYGKIHFETAEELAKFLKEFQGSTSIFEVYPDDGYVLEFKGGY